MFVTVDCGKNTGMNIREMFVPLVRSCRSNVDVPADFAFNLKKKHRRESNLGGWYMSIPPYQLSYTDLSNKMCLFSNFGMSDGPDHFFGEQ